MKLNFSFFFIHVAIAAPSFDADIAFSDRSLTTNCFGPMKQAVKDFGTMKQAVVVWKRDKDEFEDGGGYGSIENWCTKDVSSFRETFKDDVEIKNEDLSGWDTAASTDFYRIFFRATSFNGDLSSWDTSKTTDFRGSFNQAKSFNGDITSWDTSKAETFTGMFRDTRLFDQDISGWDSSNVSNFSTMFYYAHKFNQNLSRWDISKGTYFQDMFKDAIEFDQVLKWCFTGNVELSGMMSNTKGGNASYNCVTPFPTSKPSTSPTLFTAQNFVIGKPQSRLNENLGDFSVPLNYTEVGQSVDFLSVTLREAGCDKPVNDTVITMNNVFFEKTDFDTPSVLIDTTKFAGSSLIVNKSQGESIGFLKFCVRAEGFDGDSSGENVSVSFRQDDFTVAYDLTNNSFTVKDNKITADEILLSENNITASYSVDAFRCSTDYVSDGTSSTILKQNDIVYVCIKPANTSVYISDFDMLFWQDEAEKYTAVSVGEIVNPLSQLSTGGTDGKTKRVASRVISKFFEGEANPFVVKGNAFLSFSSSTDSRRLRSVQDSSQVGEGSFEMEVGLEKGVSSSTARRSSITKEGAVLCVIGGILALSIGMVVYKKMRA
eukprot:CAMPEP_0194267532 /NCGR_PEP_ID=MMETSP0169-20130528/2014_1 /TAXON_ID=218684 /ORGANISM="Corethron pennatum, Strain L29A3" /LENGTH=601 /DNA_ID=CAMNT_0039008401 /DNA_START=222 /DNA_END=2027 /DNA_ORIENTATION=-